LFLGRYREALKLLNHFDIKSNILTYNRETLSKFVSQSLNLVTGKDVAVITDAGTPGVSDPAGELVSFISNQDPTIKVVPIPGASSVTAALSVSGFPGVPFLFIGFFPKKGRTALLSQIKSFDGTVIFFDSPFRIVKTLELLAKELPENTEVFLAREMTKMYETFYRGTVEKVLSDLENTPIKGSWEILVKPAKVK
jgi:16S rRNA (cytidine1402-2'-O)-methyltransferase